MSAPQFGEAQPEREYADRPAAFGIAVRDGEIAVVLVTKPGCAPWVDLPGGAIDAGEDAAHAVVREFGEETGLRIAAGSAFAKADQRFLNTDGKTYNNRATFFAVSVTGEAQELKVEDDHELAWIKPDDAVRRLRHDAHSWAVAAWLRRVKA